MYVPAHFAMTAEQVADVLASAPAGDLVTRGPDGLTATYVPMLHDPSAGELGSLVGHLARVNDQWRHTGEAMFIAHGTDDFIEADWLNTPEGATVPTWNYVTVQVHGELVAHSDPQWTLAAVRRLSLAHGDASVDALAPAAVDKMLRAIVGVELRISKLTGKAKMSQNKPPEVIAQVIDGLRDVGNEETADWMVEHSLPRARAKADLLAGLRRRRSV